MPIANATVAKWRIATSGVVAADVCFQEVAKLFSIEHAGEPEVLLPAMTLGEEVVQDYQSLRHSLKAHPMSLLRRHVAGEGIVSTAEMRAAKDGSWVATAGLVLIRQRPGTSSGVIFATLEDETGIANIIVWPQVMYSLKEVAGTMTRHSGFSQPFQ
ncbi:hypothetical protein KXR53_33745 [Inquilinus limosus]|uniref:hypothetical protein n=1 Tax=Inquilinus limosus TaxID=171674 RepID=UPI003F1669BB